MTGMGRALMGTGYGTGDKRAVEAAQQAISSPLLEDVSINGATGILINITGGPDLTLAEVNEACEPDRGGRRPGRQHHLRVGHRRARRRRGPHHRHRDRLQHARAGAPQSDRGPRRRARARRADGAADASRRRRVGPGHDHGRRDPHRSGRLRRTDAPTRRGERRHHQPRRLLHERGARSRPRRSARNRLRRRPSPGRSGRPPNARIIRPQASGGTSAPLVRRAPGQVQSPRPADELGVEESEFDKPTYLRRGLFAPE